MTYVQFSAILERISIKINWDYKVVLSPHVQDKDFIQKGDHPLSSQEKKKIVRKDRMTIDDLRNLKMMAQK